MGIVDQHGVGEVLLFWFRIPLAAKDRMFGHTEQDGGDTRCGIALAVEFWSIVNANDEWTPW